MKVILSVPDEGEGYSERTWWRLFQKRVVRTKLDVNSTYLRFYYFGDQYLYLIF